MKKLLKKVKRGNKKERLAVEHGQCNPVCYRQRQGSLQRNQKCSFLECEFMSVTKTYAEASAKPRS
jgi:hypothetical protein